MINYELAKKLKDAGFKPKDVWKKHEPEVIDNNEKTYLTISYPKEDYYSQDYLAYIPTLSELIEAVGFCFATLQQEHNDRTPEGYLKFSGWKALAVDADCSWVGRGLTPEIAVSELWLNIKNHVYQNPPQPIQGIKIK